MAAQLRETKANLTGGGDEEKEAKKIYKTIMCPIKWECPKVKRLRFPYSNLKANRKFGLDCPFAHHPMELSFPETIDVRMTANKKLGKDKKGGEDGKSENKPFVLTGALFSCNGCGGNCKMCRYRQKAKETEQKFADTV